MTQGTVKWLNAEKGYGLISRADGPDIIVHYPEIDGYGFRSLEENQHAEFEMAQRPKDPQATRVRAVMSVATVAAGDTPGLSGAARCSRPHKASAIAAYRGTYGCGHPNGPIGPEPSRGTPGTNPPSPPGTPDITRVLSVRRDERRSGLRFLSGKPRQDDRYGSSKCPSLTSLSDLPHRFPCIYPAYPGQPRATVGPALGPFGS
jgi:CspA family cold shock protein